MSEPIKTCPIWGTSYEAKGIYDPEKKIFDVKDSERSFTGYKISELLLDNFVKRISDSKKAQLTTWLIDQWCLNNDQPEITLEVLLGLARKPSLSIHERADRLLKFMSLIAKSHKLGEFIGIPWHWYNGLAWSESTDRSDVQYFLDYLEKMGWLEGDLPGPGLGQSVRMRVSFEGHARVDELQREENLSDSSQAFVAMWFDESMSEIFENGFRPAIEESGYNPLRIDRKEHINKIDDEIIAEIRRSRFIVADFTHGDDGARGGVYYEAGFAKGLGLPVIFTCSQDAVETLHFDTNHYNHIVWTTSADLREKLKYRILAVIGEGPGFQTSPSSLITEIVPEPLI